MLWEKYFFNGDNTVTYNEWQNCVETEGYEKILWKH